MKVMGIFSFFKQKSAKKELQAKGKAKQKVGLVLGGGAARGIAHLGVLKAFETYDIPIDYLAGASAGSFVGGIYAAGVSIDEMIVRVSKLKWLELISLSFSRKSMISAKKLDRYLSLWVDDIKMNELKIPFYCGATDILTGEPVHFEKTDMLLRHAIRASVSFPGFFKPFLYEGRHLVDAGVSSNMPIDAVKRLGADVVIAINVIPDMALDELPNSFRSIMDRCLDLMIRRTSDLAIKEADLALHPIQEHVGSFAIHRSRDLIELGYSCVERHLDEIKAVIED